MNWKTAVGRRGEDLAAAYLQSIGYRIVGRNVRIGQDEIDIVAEDDMSVAFVEVKSRTATETNLRYGSPVCAVNDTKQQRLIRSANGYIRQYRIQKRVHIDVIEVVFPAVRETDGIPPETLTAEKIRYIRNAVTKKTYKSF